MSLMTRFELGAIRHGFLIEQVTRHSRARGGRRSSLTTNISTTTYSLHDYCVFTPYSIHIHHIFTAYSLHIHHIFTTYSLHIHHIFTTIHCTYSLHNHTIFQHIRDNMPTCLLPHRDFGISFSDLTRKHAKSFYPVLHFIFARYKLSPSSGNGHKSLRCFLI